MKQVSDKLGEQFISIAISDKYDKMQAYLTDFGISSTIEIVKHIEAVNFDNEITYFDDVLRRWVNSLDPDSKKAKRKFIVRRDPRNISKLHFFDPEINCYFDIPYRNPSRPQTTIWEWNEAKEKLKADGLDNIDENIIFRALEKMREIENKAVKTTKTKRRKQARKKQLAQPSQGTVASINRSSNVVALPVKDEFDIDLSQITPFDELED